MPGFFQCVRVVALKYYYYWTCPTVLCPKTGTGWKVHPENPKLAVNHSSASWRLPTDESNRVHHPQKAEIRSWDSQTGNLPAMTWLHLEIHLNRMFYREQPWICGPNSHCSCTGTEWLETMSQIPHSPELPHWNIQVNKKHAVCWNRFHSQICTIKYPPGQGDNHIDSTESNVQLTHGLSPSVP